VDVSLPVQHDLTVTPPYQIIFVNKRRKQHATKNRPDPISTFAAVQR
jgi:hypothetical protein